MNESLADVLAEEEPEEPAVQLAVLRQRLEQQKVNSIGLNSCPKFARVVNYICINYSL